MKILLFILSIFPALIFAQTFENFEVQLEAVTIEDAPGVHSFAWGIDSEGRWLIIGGRIDGLHQRQPFAAFLPSDNNTNAFVIDPESQEVWSTSLSVLPLPIFEQLQSTNQEFFQRENQLYIIGGYGFSPTAGDHITFPNLTAVSVDEVTNAIIDGESITTYFRQIENEKMAVTGGYLGYLDSVFYLAGGQKFTGRYNPMGPNHGPGFEQEYTDAIRKFEIEDDGNNITIANFSESVDAVNLHRRDYNMAPQFFPDGDLGFTMFSGVFQHDVDLPFLNSVDIKPDGYMVNNNFNQYLGQYHSAHVPIYDEDNNTMHTLFFGGMSQYTLDEDGNLVEDENVPFVKTISRVSRFSDGEMEEVKLNIEMPTLVGAGAEFIPHPEVSFLATEILDLNELAAEPIHVGYIYGGIESTADNIFFTNDGSQSSASNVIFKVLIHKNNNTTATSQQVKENVFDLKIYPNPTDGQLVIDYFNPYAGTVNIELHDVNGKKVNTFFQGQVEAGAQKFLTSIPDVADGTYFISIENDKQRTAKMIFVE